MLSEWVSRQSYARYRAIPHVLRLRDIHKNLKVMSAMGTGITDHAWSLENIAAFTN